MAFSTPYRHVFNGSEEITLQQIRPRRLSHLLLAGRSDTLPGYPFVFAMGAGHRAASEPVASTPRFQPGV